MNITKTTKLLTILLLIATLSPLSYCREQKFEFKTIDGTTSLTRKKTAQPTILPTHKAFFTIKWFHHKPVTPDTEAILKTSAGQSISQLQREFLKTKDAFDHNFYNDDEQDCFSVEFTYGKSNYAFSAVSRDDAEKMAQAFVEVYLRENNKKLKPLLDEYLKKLHDKQKEFQQNIAETKTKLAEKEEELKKLKEKLDDRKKSGYYQSPEQALNAILELNAMRHTESIELAGMEAKRQAIQHHLDRVEQYIRQKGKNINWEPILLNLEQKKIDLSIDLEVAQARQQKADALRNRARDFIGLIENVNKAEKEHTNLGSRNNRHRRNLASIEKKLANPTEEMLPLQVYENTVYIRPVKIKFID